MGGEAGNSREGEAADQGRPVGGERARLATRCDIGMMFELGAAQGAQDRSAHVLGAL